MKVLLYSGSRQLIERSGVGRALYHQMEALGQNGVTYTTDRKEEWDLVHINTIFPGSYLLARRAHLAGKKVIYHGHSTDRDFRGSFIGSDLAAPLFKKWLTLCYGEADVIIAPTPYAGKLIEGYGTGKPVVTVSNGIDLSFYQREEEAGRAFRKRYGFGPEEKVILSVGLPIERKGIEDFVELARQLPGYQFIWFGDLDTPMLPFRIRELLRTELPNLHFPGYIGRKELRDAYCGSDVFLFLTKEETEGIVLLEALAMKCPVLVRDIPIYEDWLEEGRQVCKARNVDEFRETLCSMLEGDLAGRMTQMTREGYLAAQERSLKIVGRKLAEQYEKLLHSQSELCGENCEWL